MWHRGGEKAEKDTGEETVAAADVDIVKRVSQISHRPSIYWLGLLATEIIHGLIRLQKPVESAILDHHSNIIVLSFSSVK